MFAIISDIHSNLEALTAVLGDIRSRGIDEIICLGDVVGYGPDPGECLDVVSQNCREVLLGNHDWAVLYEPSRFNASAEAASYWTRMELEREDDQAKIARRWKFLGEREIRFVKDAQHSRDYGCREMVFVHGSPRKPVNEYIFPDDIYNSPNKISATMERFSHLCFVGHTHVPGVFTESVDFYSPEDINDVFDISSAKALINVGSVGQPRDRDPRGGYVIVEPDTISFVRVEYDWQKTRDKVLAKPALDDYLGTRLQEGR